MSGSRTRRRWPWVVLFLGIAFVVLFYVGGAWYFSSQVYADALKSEPYNPADLQGGTVLAYDGTRENPTITIQPDEQEPKFDDSVMGLVIGESVLVVGPVRSTEGSTQTRRVLDVIGQTARVGDRYGLTRDVWLTPEQAGMKARYIQIRTPDGRKFPTWRINSKGSDRWAILTHGKGASRSEMLRMAQTLKDRNYNLLIITYTGDVGAPPYDDGMVHYGRTEWQELEAAVQYAEDRGAETYILGGISHGGAVTLGFLERGVLARRIDGVILDAPASSLGDVIDEAAEYRSLPVGDLPIPESLEDAAKLMVAFRYGVDYSAVDYSGKEGLVDVPLLVFQGDADQTVPKPVNDRFMDIAGQGGTYVVVEGADHVLSWNVDPEGYDREMRKFLRQFRN